MNLNYLKCIHCTKYVAVPYVSEERGVTGKENRFFNQMTGMYKIKKKNHKNSPFSELQLQCRKLVSESQITVQCVLIYPLVFPQTRVKSGYTIRYKGRKKTLIRVTLAIAILLFESYPAFSCGRLDSNIKCFHSSMCNFLNG